MLLKRWLLQQEEPMFFRRGSREIGSGWGPASPLRAVGCSLAPCLCSARKPGLALPSFPSMPSFLYSHLSLLPLVILDHGFQICKTLDPVKYLLSYLIPSAAARSREVLTNYQSLQYSNLFVILREKKVWIPFKAWPLVWFREWPERFPLFSIAERDKNDLYYCDPVVSFRPAWLNLW